MRVLIYFGSSGHKKDWLRIFALTANFPSTQTKDISSETWDLIRDQTGLYIRDENQELDLFAYSAILNINLRNNRAEKLKFQLILII